MARFGRKSFRRLRVTTATRRGDALTGKRAKIYVKKPTIRGYKIRGGL